MIQIHSFSFGPFSENTYVLWDETGEGVIIDPGNSNASENSILKDFVLQKRIVLKHLLLTHAHIDHIAGNRFVYDTWKLLPEVHRNDLTYIERHKEVAAMYGLPCDESPLPRVFLNDKEKVNFGNSELELILTPGHSPGSITFYSAAQKFIICGDVLFYGSVGRTDLPGGSTKALMEAIKLRLFPLGDEVKVYSGHGSTTTVGEEREHNPFLVS
jgi:glyoxylase-like metal-dependent hydrolase (beta-lactamase superfamily II)